LLFDLWFEVPHRPTRDADFLGFGPQDAAVLGERWVDLSLEESIRFSGARLEKLVEHLRGVMDEGQVTIEAKSLHFPAGAGIEYTSMTPGGYACCLEVNPNYN